MSTKKTKTIRTLDDLRSAMRGERMVREARLDRASINEEDRTIEVAFSSETAIERWWGLEILDQSKGSVDLSELNDGAPLLINHDIDKHPGVIESARIDSADKRGRAVVRFGRSALADEKWQDVRDEILTKVSVASIADTGRTPVRCRYAPSATTLATRRAPS